MSKKGEVHYNKEYKRLTNSGTKYVYGTTNRFNAKSLYLYFKPAIRVSDKITVTKVENTIHDELIDEMNSIVGHTENINPNFISDFQFSNQQLKPGVRSKMQYELFLSTTKKFGSPEEYDGLMKQCAEKAEAVIKKHIVKFGEIAD